MPFLQPYSVTRNSARYKVVDYCEDFVLQEHRYSLRKARHYYGWARVITRGTKPRLKVAEACSIEQIRAREWKYICEDLTRGLPEALAKLPAGSEERTTWLLDKLVRVKKQLGDDECDLSEYFDEDGDLENENGDYLDCDEECKEGDMLAGHRRASSGASIESRGCGKVGSPLLRSAASDDSLLVGSAAENDSTCEDSDTDASPRNSGIEAKIQGSPAKVGAQSRFDVVRRHLRMRKPAPTTASAADAGSGKLVGTAAAGSPRSSGRVAPETGDAIEAALKATTPTPLKGIKRPRHPSLDVSVSQPMVALPPGSRNPESRERLTAQQPKGPGGRNAKLLGAPSWMRTSLTNIGLGSLATGLGGDAAQQQQSQLFVDGEPLPSYLVSYESSAEDGRPAGGKGTNAEKKAALTMEKLKREHERKSMLIGVAAATSGATVMRIVSFDAWLLLLVALNFLVCYVIRNRHALVKKLAKSSVKRRVKFTRQVWGSRWGGSKTKAPAADASAVQMQNTGGSHALLGDGAQGPSSNGEATPLGRTSLTLSRSTSQPSPSTLDNGRRGFFTESPRNNNKAAVVSRRSSPLMMNGNPDSPSFARQVSSSRILKFMTSTTS